MTRLWHRLFGHDPIEQEWLINFFRRRPKASSLIRHCYCGKRFEYHRADYETAAS